MTAAFSAVRFTAWRTIAKDDKTGLAAPLTDASADNAGTTP
jgi:hypothetical protein